VAGRVVILGGDIVIFRSWLIRDLIAAGWKVTACGPEDNYQAKATGRLGADYVAVPVDRTGLSTARDLLSISALVRTLRILQPDVFLSFHTKYNVLGPIAARLAGVPRVFALIAGLGYAFSPGAELKRKSLRAVLSSALRVSLHCCTGVFVQNEDDRALVRAERWVSRSTRVVKLSGTGVDVDEFGYTKPSSGSLRVLLMARLLREKGIADYVAAARLVKKSYPDSYFALLGPFDSNPSALRPEEVRAWQHEGILSYLGVVHDVRPHLRACNLFVLPSYYREGIPKSILEAMAVGRAIVTCNTPGCRETVIDGANGFLVPPGNPHALAEAIKRFLYHPGLVNSMGHASRLLAEERFNVREVNSTMMEEMGVTSKP
jgi:glycosyltransferase involved in cell wall biosynthesis